MVKRWETLCLDQLGYETTIFGPTDPKIELQEKRSLRLPRYAFTGGDSGSGALGIIGCRDYLDDVVTRSGHVVAKFFGKEDGRLGYVELRTVTVLTT